MFPKLPITSILLSTILLILILVAIYQSFSSQFLSFLPVGNPPSNAVPGGIIVIVKASSRDQADTVMGTYTENYYEEVTKDTATTYFFGVIVPKGQEKTWIEKFRKNPSIVEARYQLTSD